MAATGIDSLPESVWEVIVFALCQKAHGNPSDAFRLSVASRSLRASLGRLRFWHERCCLQGWLPAADRQLVQHAAAGSVTAQLGQPCGLLGAKEPYMLYQQRMQTRWVVRRAFRQLEAFLRFGAFNAGASSKDLSAAEEHLGAPLPWQLWELYRFRDGQNTGSGSSGQGGLAWPHMGSITPMANGGRMLTLSEAVGAVRARAGCEFDYIQMQGLCEQALAMGGSAARAAGSGGLQDPSETCRAHAPGGQAAAVVVDGPPSQIWLVPRPEAHVCSCSVFLDVPAAGAAATAKPNSNPTCRRGLARATLLPLTNEFSMDRQYLCDRTGRVFLRVGFQLMPAADTVVAFLNALLR